MASIWVRASVCALFAALALTGCGDDGGDGGTSGLGGMGGSGGGVAGMAGLSGGMGGATGGVGGATGGVGGATGGMGGATGGVGGMGSGGMAGGETRPGCEAAVMGTPAELHEAARMSLTMGCGLGGSCHNADMGIPRAMLGFSATMDLTAIVDKPACETPMLMVVKSGGGQPALDGSYLWQKLVAPVDAAGDVIGKPEWGAGVTTCNQTGANPFGVRMPLSAGDISDTRLAPIRNWICAGAMGPM